MSYENAQKRILEVFSKWKAPANFKIESFVVRVGEWGGHMLVDCDDPFTVHKVCSTFPALELPDFQSIVLKQSLYHYHHHYYFMLWFQDLQLRNLSHI